MNRSFDRNDEDDEVRSARRFARRLEKQARKIARRIAGDARLEHGLFSLPDRLRAEIEALREVAEDTNDMGVLLQLGRMNGLDVAARALKTLLDEYLASMN